VRLRYVARTADLGRPDLIILPGSKSTAADLAWLRHTGLADTIVARARAGGAVVGICGGFQMLGQWLRDPLGIESEVRAVAGLGLLAAITTFEPEKATHRVTARITANRGLLAGAAGLEITAYEIHMGRTEQQGRALAHILTRSGQATQMPDGVLDEDGWIGGTYLHGLFHHDDLRRRVLANLAARKGMTFPDIGSSIERDVEYDRLAAHVRASLDMALVYRLVGR
jgi:adenosylcobyric acid synthase